MNCQGPLLTVFEVRTEKYWTEAKAYGPSLRGPAARAEVQYFEYGTNKAVNIVFINWCTALVLPKTENKKLNDTENTSKTTLSKEVIVLNTIRLTSTILVSTQTGPIP